jgi:hypothetical protein
VDKVEAIKTTVKWIMWSNVLYNRKGFTTAHATDL